MIRHLFLDKTATLIKDSKTNTGFNPVAELNYGHAVTRFILHFDERQIKSLIANREIPEENLDKVRFVLKMTNATGVDGVPYEKSVKFGNTCISKSRAVSCMVLALKLPCGFDAGHGFEFSSDVWVTEGSSYSQEGCNWYQCRSGQPWDEPGVYSPETIKREYDNFSSEKPSLVVARQSFDYGEENLELDVTDYVRSIIKDKDEEGYSENNGLLICFTPAFEVLNGYAIYTKIKPGESKIADIPEYEDMPSCYDITVPEFFKIAVKETNELTGEIKSVFEYYQKKPREVAMQQYLGFFTDKTNTFFHPYLEVQYDEFIEDDREDFCLGNENKLYLYSTINGTPENLDEIPTCQFNGMDCVVKQTTKGVYCAEIPVFEANPDEIIEDTWGNIKYHGVNLDDVVMETAVHKKGAFFTFDSMFGDDDIAVPSPYGINNDETVKRGDVRQVVVDFRKKYTTNVKITRIKAWYRLYVKSGEQQIDIFNGYQPFEQAFMKNYFTVYTSELIPNNKYYVDIKIEYKGNIRIYEDALHFKIGDDVTERYP